MTERKYRKFKFGTFYKGPKNYTLTIVLGKLEFGIWWWK